MSEGLRPAEAEALWRDNLRAEPVLMDHLNYLMEQFPPPLTEIKLTQAQLDEVKASLPSPQPVLDPAAALLAVPIHLVGTVEESTPFKLKWHKP
jgi:hypothetical protein